MSGGAHSARRSAGYLLGIERETSRTRAAFMDPCAALETTGARAVDDITFRCALGETNRLILVLSAIDFGEEDIRSVVIHICDVDDQLRVIAQLRCAVIAR